VPILLIALFSALANVLLLLDRAEVAEREDGPGMLAFGAIAVAFQLGVWQGFVQLLAAMAAVELGRLVRNKSRAGA